MLKKLSSIAAIGVLALTLSACGQKTTQAPVNQNQNVGINANVGAKPEVKKVSDSANVGVSLKVNPPKPAVKK